MAKTLWSFDRSEYNRVDSLFKIEELKLVPEQSAKTMEDLKKKQERLEKEKQKEEVKLKDVMDSLKTETQVNSGTAEGRIFGKVLTGFMFI